MCILGTHVTHTGACPNTLWCHSQCSCGQRLYPIQLRAPIPSNCPCLQEKYRRWNTHEIEFLTVWRTYVTRISFILEALLQCRCSFNTQRTQQLIGPIAIDTFYAYVVASVIPSAKAWSNYNSWSLPTSYKTYHFVVVSCYFLCEMQ